VAASIDPVYKAECGSCHMPVHGLP
jgi:hypothetical protein